MTHGRTLRVGLLAASALALAPAAHAEGLDDSRPLQCSFAEAAQCDRSARCDVATLQEIGLPEVVRLDFGAKQLAAMGDQRTSPIAAVELQDTSLVVQGHQGGRGWLLVVERASGHMSATVADVEGAFVLSGACAAQP